ncbi:CDP-alcohol phosphatidyltransferase [Amaricoccus solimangrovi]|uniref:CDP-alcohol phosphatidyltransferase n=1 Tax=Amaricoccus solimangrovi TaxID=2589815 RepID=A0A501WFK0_9RHOB|nr:CDP-alcohol phosphatidyltransferase [Amaricoccus solimangrovi]
MLAAAWAAPAGAAPACLALAIFAVVVAVARGGLDGFHPPDRFGAANAVTLARAGGAALIAAAGIAGAAPAGAAAWGVALASAALLALDGIDGWLARRAGLASPFGARFDMEVDALTGLALALLVWQMGKAGPWVLGLGLMRYAFLGLGRLRPAFAAPLPPSRRRKAVCVVQLAALTLLVAPPVVPPLSQAIAAGALALLGWSFARDLLWLARR